MTDSCSSPILALDIVRSANSNTFPSAQDIDFKEIIQETLQHTSFIEACEITLTLTDDLAVQALNKAHRGKDKPTNVLSFPAYDPNDPHVPGEVIHLGDIVLAYETITHEAMEQNKSFEDHLTHLIVHGSLHLLGYDHEDDTEAQVMEALEIKILSTLGIKNPYEIL